METTTKAETVPPSLFSDTVHCAGRYRISTASWRRLVDAGRAPQPIRLGHLVRWSNAVLAQWDADGNPPVRTAKRA